jgi:hypothetical protein
MEDDRDHCQDDQDVDPERSNVEEHKTKDPDQDKNSSQPKKHFIASFNLIFALDNEPALLLLCWKIRRRGGLCWPPL